MNNYYILSIDSLIRTFSILENDVIKFTLTIPDIKDIFSDIKEGDIILGYIKKPIHEVKYIFEVIEVENSNDKLYLKKKLEVSEGVKINIIDFNEDDLLTKIDYKEYSNILKELLQNCIEFKNNSFTSNAIQKIYYGAPGTGKSYSVSNILNEKYPNISVRENPFVIRTTIHQDYSYYDFIGSLQPDLDEKNNITYTFKPGPFSIALKKAFLNPKKEIILVIEEMSRGNIAAIFGDIFQLLDRVNGFSEYPIDNKLITDYLRKDSNINIIEDKVYIPNNLSIIGTVNTSDQNVNVMDTAFKRRFSFEYVSVDPIKDSNNMYLNSFSFELGKFEFNWIDLYRALNKFIVENLGLNEDKQIGQFFIKFDENKDKDNILQIKDKLLQYLWEDVQNIAISEETIFDKEIKTFGQLYKEFENKNIFSETFMNVYNSLSKLVDKKNDNEQLTNSKEEIE
jgi:putative restriction enzyme